MGRTPAQPKPDPPPKPEPRPRPPHLEHGDTWRLIYGIDGEDTPSYGAENVT
jgi:hypothetical protein